MSTSIRAKRALVAYSVLAEKLRTPGASLTTAMEPFWAEVCGQFSNELFDAAKFSLKAEELYGFKIPRLAVLGMAEQLARAGLILVKSKSQDHTVYEYPRTKADPPPNATNPLTEREVLRILESFVHHARTDEKLADLSDEDLQNAFLDRLLNLESMRILSRKDESTAAKKTSTTLTLTKPRDEEDKKSLHLDFLVSEFLLILRDKEPSDFEKVSDIAFANMAAEALACFNEPESSSPELSSLTVYLDSPLLLDILGVNTEYAAYGKELLALIHESGARPAILDHCIAEAESTIYAQLMHLRSGINSVSYNWGTTTQPDLLSALSNHVADRANDQFGIEVQKDPVIALHKAHQSAVGTIDEEMTRRMQGWKSSEGRDYDKQSIWAMLRLRDTSMIYRRICDAKSIFLTRNAIVVSIANNSWNVWLNETTRHSRSLIGHSAPVAMSDKQFAGYLWVRTGGTAASMSRARLLAHCSSAVRPRADVKARAYNLVLELSGQEEASYFIALLEDREAALGLMAATRGDPADVTPERIPYIIEQVKLAAGEFAASKEREKAEIKITKLQRELNEKNAAVSRELESAKEELTLKGNQAAALKSEVDALIKDEAERQRRLLLLGLAAGTFAYKMTRWTIAILFGLATGLTSLVTPIIPVWLSFMLVVGMAVVGFWFVPELLNKHICRLANFFAKKKIANMDPKVAWPETADFIGQSLTDSNGAVICLNKQGEISEVRP